VSETKPTNPKDLIGTNKIPLHLWPETATVMGALGCLDGMLKYGRTNWRAAGIRTSVYIDALRRHTNRYFEGEDLDPDSDLPHFCHMLATLGILVDAWAAGNVTDDRQFHGAGYPRLIEQMTPHVERLLAKHAGRTPRHYTIVDQYGRGA
jgi:hypothetical protein